MHLKSYQIDGRLLRTGAANFSASCLMRQNNDLIVIESAEAAVQAHSIVRPIHLPRSQGLARGYGSRSI
jgi:phosphatidylserine/phosphatidylglycerophosphate/cardiolipin synthase-like enzyme